MLPVALAAWVSGRRAGLALAVALPLLRLSFDLVWGVPESWTLAIADATVDCLVLVGFAILVSYLAQQQQELRVLRGMLPICCFCKQSPLVLPAVTAEQVAAIGERRPWLHELVQQLSRPPGGCDNALATCQEGEQAGRITAV